MVKQQICVATVAELLPGEDEPEQGRVKIHFDGWTKKLIISYLLFIPRQLVLTNHCVRLTNGGCWNIRIFINNLNV